MAKMVSDGTTKRINLLKASVLWRVKVNCKWCCGKDLLTACVIAIWFVVSFDVFGLSCAVRVVVSFDGDFLSVSVVALTIAGMRCSVRVLSALGRWARFVVE